MAAALVGSLLPTIPAAISAAAAASYSKPRVPSSEKPVKGSAAKAKELKADTTVSDPKKARTSWPQPGSAIVALPGSSAESAAGKGLPIALAAPEATKAATTRNALGARDAEAPVREARVTVLDQEKARKAGVNGVLFTLAGTESAGSAKVSVDYSTFAQAGGGAFGSRLRLVQLPDCALTTPDRPECRTQTPLAGTNNTETQTVTADAVTVGATAPASLRAPSVRSAAAGVTLLAAAATTAGPSGDYKVTPLSAASTWSTALNTGSFTWSYDMPMPAMPGGLSPKLGLSYNSAGVDGRTANSNNQASWVGDGFDLSPGFIERSYKPCADEGVKTNGTEPGDLCWAYDNATISFAGHSGELIPVGANEWRIKGDDNTKVTRGRDVNRGNGDDDGEYFRAVTPDGTRYYFGYNRLSNWTAGKPETKSVYTVPVYGNNAGEPCNKADFASSWCQQGWRWNLDLVIDAKGNDITYWYHPETNNYGRNLKASDHTQYVRGGYLERIDYGQQQSDIYSTTVKPMAQVTFKTAERCLETTAGRCDGSKIDANRQYWYDTPWDQTCKDNTDCDTVLAPSFFTRTRLTGIAVGTLQADGTYQTTDTWNLTHRWGTADFDYQLLLDSVEHVGGDKQTITLPKTTFAYTQLVNRLDKVGDGRAAFIKQRLSTVTDELGGQVDVNYSAAPCTWSSLPIPQDNRTLCFPQMYQPSLKEPVTTEWFNKYVVNTVITTDRTGGAPDMLTRYTYLGDPAWHYDDDQGITKEKLKTWSQWRGYAQTRVQTGGTSAMSTQADHFFLRGMDGDRTDPADKTRKRSVTTSDGEGNSIVDDAAWAGYEYRTEQFDKPAGKVLAKTVRTPWKKETAKREMDWGTSTANLTGTSSLRSLTSLDDGAGVKWRETRTNNTYDNYGRSVQVESLGDGTDTADDKCTAITYADNTTAWILTGAIHAETVAVKCSVTVNRDTRTDGTSAVLSDVRTRYDGQAYGAAPTKGLPTLTHTLKARTGTSATYLDNTATYDKYGRAVSATGLASTTVFDTTDATAPVTTASPNARTSSTVYTPAVGRPVTSVVTGPPATAGNPSTSQSTTTEFDLARGLPVATIDTNNRRTDVLYDPLGRTLKIWLPDRSKANGDNPNSEFQYLLASGKITAVTTKSLNADGSQDTSYTLYDGLGRARQTQAPGDSGGRILTDVFYDARGQAALTYAPYYSTGAPTTTLLKVEDATGVETQTATTYDGLGRANGTTVLAGNGVGKPLASTLTTYGGDRVTVTPPDGGTPTTTIIDAAGRTTELRQYKDKTLTGYDATTYAYDPAGHLTKLTDPSGTTWTWLYDQLGRQTKAVDPDSGTTSKTYNDRSEATTVTDGRGKTVATVYDNIGRVLETRDTSATGTLLTSRDWDPAGNKGLLNSSTRYVTLSGTTYQYKTSYSFYDQLGRPERTTVTVPSVPGQEALAGDYISATSYRFDGLPTGMSLTPAGGLATEAVVFTYDNLHRVTAATGSGQIPYLTDQKYSLTGKPLQATFSNGTAGKDIYVTNDYEWGTQRLASSRTDQYGISTPARAAVYTYDQVGNVTSLTDTSGTGTDRQCYQYDYLTRLAEAFTPKGLSCPTAPDGASLGGPAPYWSSYTYNTNGTRATETQHDPIGNAALDARTTYTYPVATAARPHSLASTSKVTGALGTPVVQSYSYDTSGNTTARHLQPTAAQSSDQVLTWNSEGRLAKVADTVKTTTGTSITTTSKTTDNLYDADGNRLITHALDTANPATESWTLYLGNTEVKLLKGAGKASATRYIPLGLATAVRTDDNKVTFQVADHHGTAELDIDATTGTLNQRRTTPFGDTRGKAPSTWSGNRGFLGGTSEPTGLTHLGARDYDPTTGRFISVDPILAATDPQSLTGYTYSNNNPLTLSDPSGQRPDGACGGFADSCRTPDGEIMRESWIPHGDGDWEVVIQKSDDAVLPGGVVIPKSTYSEQLLKKTDDNLRLLQKNHTVFGYDPREDYHQYIAASLNACWAISSCSNSEAYKILADQLFDYNFENYAFAGVGDGSFQNSVVGRAMAKEGKLKPRNNSVQSKAGGACNSFPAGTRVLLSDGSSKRIEELKVGDEVVAADPSSGESGARAVDATIVTPDDAAFTTLTLSDGLGQITSTDHHPFWSPSEDRWVDASDLEPGMTLLDAGGGVVRVSAAQHFGKVQAAYNLTIRGLHTYYVLAGNTPVLVHNTGPGCGLGGFKVGVTPDEITGINRGFGGETLLSGSPENTMINASRYDSFWDKSAVVIRDIAGSHMFNNGNKRTAQAVVEQLMERNGVTSGPTSEDLRSVIDRVGKGQLHDIGDISSALRGY
ncbi:polymorphic toxin-type HINT domain-containing protein [Kitasatospora sp. GP82]|uniref:polymorphic toxin-type HINT domain-containing protein n=1 Tax=Kitasatospora sp. GP82 TaxID=3035089 RepID=UPI00247327C0|nr:polymorphic toxin-type HINT domain-containing protein [Kitasatospora sp. GP82]MDH6123946.1 RHS repeat-associated protein [Kitasatospora sp. GP82]